MMGCVMFLGGLLMVLGGLLSGLSLLVVFGALIGLMAFSDPMLLPTPRDWSLPVEAKFLGHRIENGCDVYTVQASNMREVARFTEGTTAPGERAVTKVGAYTFEIRNHKREGFVR